MRSRSLPSLAAAILSVGWLTTGQAMAQAGGDPISNSDPFNGAVFDDARSTDYINCCDIPNLDAIFDGTTTASIFSDAVDMNNPAVLTFTRDNTIPIFGVNLFTGSDDPVATETAARSTGNFTLSADNDNDGTFETVLVAGGDPIDDGRSNFFPFIGSSTATVFQATFTPGSTSSNDGPRVFELDAVTVPEPTALALMALGGIGLLARRRV